MSYVGFPVIEGLKDVEHPPEPGHAVLTRDAPEDWDLIWAPTHGECPLCHGPLKVSRYNLGRCVADRGEHIAIDPRPGHLEAVGCKACKVVFYRQRSEANA